MYKASASIAHGRSPRHATRSMAGGTACASCARTRDLKHCARCKTVSHCLTALSVSALEEAQRACHFRVTASHAIITLDDALSLLRAMPEPGTAVHTPAVAKLLNTFELRLAIFSELPALDLLRTQWVCRAGYLTIALETKLQQRLFLTPGPGELVLPASTGNRQQAVATTHTR